MEMFFQKFSLPILGSPQAQAYQSACRLHSACWWKPQK